MCLISEQEAAAAIATRWGQVWRVILLFPWPPYRREAGALQPLVQLLAIGAQMAARERELCCVVLRTLRELAPVSKDALAQARMGAWVPITPLPDAAYSIGKYR